MTGGGHASSATGRWQIVPFSEELATGVVDLILGIQRGEFGMQITAEQQPDLARIPGFYQVGNGNFWAAVSGETIVGTIALLDIGSSRAALRKMFVHREFRGAEFGVATGLLDTALAWSADRRLREIFLGTTAHFHAAHRFYEKNGFLEIPRAALPDAFPVMEVDSRFYRRAIRPAARSERPSESGV